VPGRYSLAAMEEREYVKMDAVEERMFFYRALHERMVSCLDRFAPTDAAVLDAGCGTGGLLVKLQRRRPSLRLSGLDVSKIACELARRKTGLPIEQASVDELPFGDEQFDVIVASDVLCMLEDPSGALGEFRRCLRPGGTLVVNLPAYEALRSYHDEATDTKHRYTEGELVPLLRRSGFATLFVTYWNTLLFPLAVLKRKLFPSRGSDVRLYPPLMDAVFGAVLELEAIPIRRGIRLPFGLSLLSVARR
jgi:SAM-dependent methyltransferase